MFCKNCGEENLDNAVYCKNCGAKLKEDEVKKTEIIEAPVNNQQSHNTATNSSSNEGRSDWLSCCLCLVGIFIIFAIIGLL